MFMKVVSSYDIAVGASTTAAVHATGLLTRHVRLASNVGCYVAWGVTGGAAVTAAAPGTTSTINVVRVTAGYPIILRVDPNVKFSAIEDVQAATGVVTVSELDG